MHNNGLIYPDIKAPSYNPLGGYPLKSPNLKPPNLNAPSYNPLGGYPLKSPNLKPPSNEPPSYISPNNRFVKKDVSK